MRINVLLYGLMFFGLSTFAQNKNFLDQPYLETGAEVDTLVIPDQDLVVVFLFNCSNPKIQPWLDHILALIYKGAEFSV